MTGIVLSAGRCGLFVAGGETQCNPRIEIEHIFLRRGKHLSKEGMSTSSQLLRLTFRDIYPNLSLVVEAGPKNLGHNAVMTWGQLIIFIFRPFVLTQKDQKVQAS